MGKMLDPNTRLIWEVVVRLDLRLYYGEIAAVEGHAGRGLVTNSGYEFRSRIPVANSQRYVRHTAYGRKTRSTATGITTHQRLLDDADLPEDIQAGCHGTRSPATRKFHWLIGDNRPKHSSSLPKGNSRVPVELSPIRKQLKSKHLRPRQPPSSRLSIENAAASGLDW
jgi:hypothetical protein